MEISVAVIVPWPQRGRQELWDQPLRPFFATTILLAGDASSRLC